MCLSLEMQRPDDVLQKGVFFDYPYIVMSNRIGYRCGYIKVPDGHPWHGLDYDEINADVHWGLTFTDYDTPCGQEPEGEQPGYWLGFDCAHAGDAPDPTLCSQELYRQSVGLYPGVIRNTSYVVNECIKLCIQARGAVAEGQNEQ